VENIVLLVG